MPFNKLNHKHLGELRPRFVLRSNVKVDKIISEINLGIEADHSVSGSIRGDYAVLRIPIKNRHYWSPELQVRVEEDEFCENQSTLIQCLVGPRSSVWGLFVFLYGVIGIIALIGGIYGASHYQLGKESIFIWFFPIGIILIPTIYVLAKIGQKKGRDQMLHLISFVYHHVDRIGTVERAEN